MIPLFAGCGAKSESPTIKYTSEILISQEYLPENFMWYAVLHAPTPGSFVMEFPSYSTYAAFDANTLVQRESRDYRDILDLKVPFKDSFFDKVAFFFSRKSDQASLKVFGMTSEEFDQKINRYIDMDDFNYYPDRVIGVIYPIIYQGETEPMGNAEYSKENILVDYDYETSVVITYTDEELQAEGGGLYSANYTGRIGDRYYLQYGYYDITDRKLCPYESEDDLPPYEELFDINDIYSLGKVIRNYTDISEYIPEGYYVHSYVRLGDRYYAVLSRSNRYYGENIDDYDGDSIFVVTMDAITGDLLYLQKIHFENYWGYEFKLCILGDDGILYDVMLP